jgi:hypothetical protein
MPIRNKKKLIKNTYEYFDVVDFVWWESFFNSQSDTISSSTNEDTFLKTPFHWPQNMSNESEERNIVKQQEYQGAIEFTQAGEMSGNERHFHTNPSRREEEFNQEHK